MVAQRSIIGYFGAQVKQPKRKGNPSAKDTGVIEKKHGDSLTVRVRKFQESWKETFPCWIVHGANNNTVLTGQLGLILIGLILILMIIIIQ